MSRLKLEYEILISGVYPFESEFEKYGFKIVKNKIDEKIVARLTKESVIYLSPFVGLCCYSDDTGIPVYLTFRKEDFIEIDYKDKKEFDTAFTNQYLLSSDILESINLLEKAMVLEVNNDIKFPAKMIRAYDPEGNLVTFLANFMKLNVPSLLHTDQKYALEVIKRQNNRLTSKISYKSITDLADNNKFFKNALTMYHSSFSVSDSNAGFVLLVTALESLLGLTTYAKAESCSACGQKQFRISSTVSENVSLILMDQDETIRRRVKRLYTIRSKFVHNGIEISSVSEQELQEYVRKVLLMYWYVSMDKDICEHEKLMAEIRSEEYKKNPMYQIFLMLLDNTSFEERRELIWERYSLPYLDSKQSGY